MDLVQPQLLTSLHNLNLLKFLKNYSTRLHHVHCKDIRKEVLDVALKDDLSFIDAFFAGAFTVPGDGCIN